MVMSLASEPMHSIQKSNNEPVTACNGNPGSLLLPFTFSLQKMPGSRSRTPEGATPQCFRFGISLPHGNLKCADIRRSNSGEHISD